MTTIFVSTDSIPSSDLANCVEALNRTLLKWAPKWNINATATTDSKVKADMVIKVTDLNRQTGALGYHTVEKGVPTAYCSPRAVGRTYGHYLPALFTREVKVLGKVVKKATLIHPASYTQGLVTVIIHEALEMLADANIDHVATAPDGKKWLVEVCDHVSGIYGTENVAGNICVIPDATFPSYYQSNGVAPFDLFNTEKSAFDRSAPKFYAFYQDANGKWVAV